MDIKVVREEERFSRGQSSKLLYHCIKNYYFAIYVCIKGLILKMGLLGSHRWHSPHNSPQPV